MGSNNEESYDRDDGFHNSLLNDANPVIISSEDDTADCSTCWSSSSTPSIPPSPPNSPSSLNATITSSECQKPENVPETQCQNIQPSSRNSSTTDTFLCSSDDEDIYNLDHNKTHSPLVTNQTIVLTSSSEEENDVKLQEPECNKTTEFEDRNISSSSNSTNSFYLDSDDENVENVVHDIVDLSENPQVVSSSNDSTLSFFLSSSEDEEQDPSEETIRLEANKNQSVPKNFVSEELQSSFRSHLSLASEDEELETEEQLLKRKEKYQQTASKLKKIRALFSSCSSENEDEQCVQQNIGTAKSKTHLVLNQIYSSPSSFSDEVEIYDEELDNLESITQSPVKEPQASVTNDLKSSLSVDFKDENLLIAEQIIKWHEEDTRTVLTANTTSNFLDVKTHLDPANSPLNFSNSSLPHWLLEEDDEEKVDSDVEWYDEESDNSDSTTQNVLEKQQNFKSPSANESKDENFVPVEQVIKGQKEITQDTSRFKKTPSICCISSEDEEIEYLKPNVKTNLVAADITKNIKNTSLPTWFLEDDQEMVNADEVLRYVSEDWINSENINKNNLKRPRENVNNDLESLFLVESEDEDFNASEELKQRHEKSTQAVSNANQTSTISSASSENEDIEYLEHDINTQLDPPKSPLLLNKTFSELPWLLVEDLEKVENSEDTKKTHLIESEESLAYNFKSPSPVELEEEWEAAGHITFRRKENSTVSPTNKIIDSSNNYQPKYFDKNIKAYLEPSKSNLISYKASSYISSPIDDEYYVESETIKRNGSTTNIKRPSFSQYKKEEFEVVNPETEYSQVNMDILSEGPNRYLNSNKSPSLSEEENGDDEESDNLEYFYRTHLKTPRASINYKPSYIENEELEYAPTFSMIPSENEKQEHSEVNLNAVFEPSNSDLIFNEITSLPPSLLEEEIDKYTKYNQSHLEYSKLNDISSLKAPNKDFFLNKLTSLPPLLLEDDDEEMEYIASIEPKENSFIDPEEKLERDKKDLRALTPSNASTILNIGSLEEELENIGGFLPLQLEEEEPVLISDSIISHETFTSKVEKTEKLHQKAQDQTKKSDRCLVSNLKLKSACLARRKSFPLLNEADEDPDYKPVEDDVLFIRPKSYHLRNNRPVNMCEDLVDADAANKESALKKIYFFKKPRKECLCGKCVRFRDRINGIK